MNDKEINDEINTTKKWENFYFVFSVVCMGFALFLNDKYLILLGLITLFHSHSINNRVCLLIHELNMNRIREKFDGR